MNSRINDGLTTAAGWCHFRMPPSVVGRFAHEPLVSDFLVTHIGFFPCSHGHEARRPHPLHEGIFILCLAGRGWVAPAGTPDAPRCLVEPGDALLVAPEVPHSYAADENDPWSISWFHFAGPRAHQFAAQWGVPPGISKGPVTSLWALHDLMERMIELRRKGFSRAVLMEVNALGEVALARLYSDAGLSPIGPPGADPAKDVPNRAHKLQRALAFLQVNFTRELTVAEVAQACHVSASWLFHAFPEHTGFSPLHYAINLRLQEACRLLALTDRKVAEIAVAVGYEDEFYFSRLFKKHLELSPDAYRRLFGR
jgi:AraC-like DNA-binding protein